LRVTHSPVLLTLDALAVARLTRLLVMDSITRPARDWIVKGGRPMLIEFSTCPWCVSPYLAAGVVVLQRLAPTICLYVTAVLAFSAVAGFLAER
jgi:hypothetical protein